MTADFIVPVKVRKVPDPIHKSKLRYELDKRKNKIDVGIGEYRDNSGNVWTPDAVIKAWRTFVNQPPQVSYLVPRDEHEFVGDNSFLKESAKLVLGEKQTQILLKEGRLATIGTTGGTQAVALFIEFLKTTNPDSSILIGLPTWPIHLQILDKHKVPFKTYNHMSDNEYNFETHLKAIKNSNKKSVILMHGGRTHNPTGVNPDNSQWQKIIHAASDKRIFFDAPYIGLDQNITSDTKAIRDAVKAGISTAIAISFAKNAGLYNERPGALLIITSKPYSSIEVQRVLNSIARSIYSTPAATGEKIITSVLTSPVLRKAWEKDLKKQAETLEKRRSCFALLLPSFAFVTKQKGLFSIIPLNKTQTDKLEHIHAVYMPVSQFGARINFGGIMESNIKDLAKAIKKVL